MSVVDKNIDHGEVGLKVNNNVIRKLSGPSSYYILLPPIENPTLPIQILLGDIHRGFENPCEDGYSIHDKEFLGILDEVAKTYPIHFYTESAFGKFLNGIEDTNDGYLFSKVVSGSKECYNKESRKNYKYESDCPTTYLYWHHVDSRYFDSSVEGFLSRYLQHFLRAQLSANFVVEDWYETFDKSLYEDPMVTSGLVITMLLLQKIIDFSLIEPRLLDYNDLSHSKQSYIRSLDLAGKSTDEVYMNESGLTSHYENLAESMMNIYLGNIFSETSSMRRQIEKGMSAYREKFSILFKQHVPHFVSAVYGIESEYLAIVLELIQVTPLQKRRIAVPSLKKLKQCVQKLDILFTYFTSSLVDLYFITRQLRETPSCLTIGYLGDIHVANLWQFLTTELKYVSVSSFTHPRQKRISRCIEFKESIDLDYILLRHAHLSFRLYSIIEHHGNLIEEYEERERTAPFYYRLKARVPFPESNKRFLL